MILIINRPVIDITYVTWHTFAVRINNHLRIRPHQKKLYKSSSIFDTQQYLKRK